ncbi:MAG: hypothetical protein DIJKHBIC_04411 [Thermoanaerobaculia bacterium]|nr:hypothetical protein [Thermoanaerobaculia bacterium]
MGGKNPKYCSRFVQGATTFSGIVQMIHVRFLSLSGE